MALRDLLTGTGPSNERATLDLDRIACRGHGVCAQMIPAIELDEWGYPIIRDPRVQATDGAAAIRLCPARALRWK